MLYYVDPMHPAYRSDRPGKAPDCGMDLVPVYAGSRSVKSSSNESRQRPPDAGPGTGCSSADRDGTGDAGHTWGAHRGPRDAGRGPDISCFGGRGRLGAARVLGPNRNASEARRGTGGLFQQRHLSAATSLCLRAGILRALEADALVSGRATGPGHAATGHGARQPAVPRDGARRRSRNSAGPDVEVSRHQSHRARREAGSWSATWRWASGS